MTRPRKRRRQFAWQSSSPEGPTTSCHQDGAEAAEVAGEAEEGGSCSSSASSPPRGGGVEEERRETLVFHTTVGEVDTFLHDRERCAADSLATADARPSPPLGAATVARRRTRLRDLRRDADVVGFGGAWPSAALAEAAAQLRGRGFVVVDDFLSGAHLEALRAGVKAHAMKPWHIGIGGPSGAAPSTMAIRGDLVAYPDVDATTAFGAALRAWLGALDALVAALGRLMRRPGELGGVAAREAPMATCYPPGAGIIRHYDNNCEDGSAGDCNGRRLTTILYLNPSWSDANWGHLRVIGQRGRSYDVRPELGALVLFWADRRTAHEVLPNRGPKRFALSCWYVDGAEGRPADAADVAPMAAATTAPAT